MEQGLLWRGRRQSIGIYTLPACHREANILLAFDRFLLVLSVYSRPTEIEEMA